MAEYGWGWRHFITFLAFSGFVFLYALRVNLSVAIVAMLNQTALQASKQEYYDAKYNGTNTTVSSIPCARSDDNSTSDSMDGPFIWNEQLQGLILASFFYGYIVTQIPGGFLASWIGAKWVFGCGICLTALLTLLTPMAAQLGAGYLIALRILEGLCEGVTWPALQILFSHWAPPCERSQLPAFAASGCQIGTVVAFMFSGILADSGFLGGWPSIFYVFGLCGCIWFIFWAILASSTPASHRWISEKERGYIVWSLEKEGHKKRPDIRAIPWTKVLVSLPFIAAAISHFTQNWCSYVLLTGLPTYMNDVLGFDMKSNGIFSSLPYLFQGIVQMVSGKIADLMRGRLHWSTTTVRKLFDCTGHFLPAIFLVAVGYVGCNSEAALTLLILAVGITGLNAAGYNVNFIDLAPQFSGILFGISNTFATIPGMIGPSVTGALIEGAQGTDLFIAWRNVFFIAGAFYVFSTVFYFIFGKGEVQPWAIEKHDNSDMINVIKDKGRGIWRC